MSEVTALDLAGYSKFLPNQYNNSPNVVKLLEIYLNQVGELETANIALNDVSTTIGLASGYQLDLIGKLVGAERLGRSDTDYRLFIQFRITVNSCNGTPENIFDYLSFITTTTNIRYWEHYPASVVIYLEGSVTPDSSIPSQVQSILPAGVSLGAIGYSNNNDLIFIPYDKGSIEESLLLNTLDPMIIDTGEILKIQTQIDTTYLQNGYLAEEPAYELDQGFGRLAEIL